MTQAVLRGLLVIRLIESRRSARKAGTYVGWAFLLGFTLVVQEVTGLGAASTGDRPDSRGTALALMAGIGLSAVLAGVGGPVWAVLKREAQWIVTAPGGARALVAWRTGRSVLSRLLNIMLLVPLAQVTSGHRPDFQVAAVLAIWYAGFGLTNTGIRYGAAAVYARSRSHWLARAATAGLLGGAFLLLSTVPPVMTLLGRPGTGSGTGAFVTASVWLVVGMFVAAAGISWAEALVTRAIAEGDPALKKAKRSWLESRTRTAEPDQFRLAGAAAFGWMALMNRRKQRWRQALASSVVLSLAVVVAVFARPWAPAVAGGLAFLLLLTSAAVRLPGPAVQDGRLLPLSVRSVAAWKIVTVGLANAMSLSLPWSVALAMQAGNSELLIAGTICLVPFSLLNAVLDWSRVPDVESGGARFRRLGTIAGATVAPAVALAWWQPGVVGALLAAAWLVAASLATAWHGVLELERTLRPIPG